MFRKRHFISFFSCLAVFITFLISSNNFWEDKEIHIDADGRAYYEYLPATFIYKDLKLNYLDTLESEYYDTKLMGENFYPKVNGVRNNKYFIGTAVLQIPSFLLAHAYATLSGKYKTDGFSEPYQNFSYYNNLLFFFLGLLCVFGILRSYEIKYPLILLSLLGLCFCTSLSFYAYYDSSYSHIYSFTLIAFFIFSIRKYIRAKSKKFIYLTVITLFLILLVRPVNGLIVLFIPLIFGSVELFLSEFKILFKERKKEILISVLIGFCLLFIQSLSWYFSSGKWLSYSYGKEGFIWGHEHFIDFLFSVKKGFFFWSPWFFFCFLFATVACIIKKEFKILLLFLVPFYILIFVCSSWWCWTYGGSLGSRPLVDFYAAFILFFVPLFQWKPKFSTVFLSCNLLLFAPLIIIQVVQYQRYIIKQDDMNWKEYKEVFLRTDRAWTAFLYRKEYKVINRAISNKLITRELTIEPMHVTTIDSLEFEKKENTLFVAEYSFKSKNLNQDNWIDIFVKDTTGELVSRQTVQFKNVLKHPSVKNVFLIRQELPLKSGRFRVLFQINSLDKKSKLENVVFNLFEAKCEI